jgi:acetyl esterase/lipase
LLIHGGGWAIGDKADAREKNIATNLTAAGYAVFSINYHLERKETDAEGKPQTVIAWPQNFQDCKSALRFLKKEAGRFGIDPKRIATMGGSAGGHLALLVGMTAGNPDMNSGGLYTEQSNDVACIIDLYGIPDVRRFGRQNFAGATPQDTEENFRKASPVTYLGQNTPPILILHGTADKIVPLELSRDFAAQLKERNLPYEYVEVPDAPHTFHLQSTSVDLGPVVIAFLKKHLGQP